MSAASTIPPGGQPPHSAASTDGAGRHQQSLHTNAGRDNSAGQGSLGQFGRHAAKGKLFQQSMARQQTQPPKDGGDTKEADFSRSDLIVLTPVNGLQAGGAQPDAGPTAPDARMTALIERVVAQIEAAQNSGVTTGDRAMRFTIPLPAGAPLGVTEIQVDMMGAKGAIKLGLVGVPADIDSARRKVLLDLARGLARHHPSRELRLSRAYGTGVEGAAGPFA